MVTPQSLLLHSPLRILGTHTHAPSVSFKPPGPGRKPRSTTWESRDIAITLTAGSLNSYFCVSVFNFPDRAHPWELLGHLVWCWSILSGFVYLRMFLSFLPTWKIVVPGTVFLGETAFLLTLWMYFPTRSSLALFPMRGLSLAWWDVLCR